MLSALVHDCPTIFVRIQLHSKYTSFRSRKQRRESKISSERKHKKNSSIHFQSKTEHMHEARSVYFWALSHSHSTLPYTHSPHTACLGKCYSRSVVVFTLLGIRLNGKRNAYPFHMLNMLKIDKSRANCQFNRFEHGVTALSTSTSSHRI